MRLRPWVYLNSLPIHTTFEQFLYIISKLETRLDEKISLETISTLVDSKDAKILFDYLDIIGNSVLALLLVLFNQLQLVFYKTQPRPANSPRLEKYSNAVEFFKSQMKEFIACVSLLKDSDYLKVADTSELNVDVQILEKVLDLLTSGSDLRVLDQDVVVLADIDGIMAKIDDIPNFDENHVIVEGKSKQVVVLKSSKSLIISSCLDCTVYLLGTVDSLYIDNCSNVTVYISACGIANVDNVHLCSLKGVFRQVWIQNSVKSSLAIYTEKESIISNCSDLVMSPIDFCWDGHPKDIKVLLDCREANIWNFKSWISKNCRNISVIDPQDFSSISLPFSRDSDSIKSCCPLQIPQDYKKNFEIQEALLSSLREFINVQSHLYPDFLKDVETSVSEWLKNSTLTEEYIKLSQEMP